MGRLPVDGDGTSERPASQRAQPDLEDVTRRIVERLQPRRIVLFGSHARGDEDPDSDYDLFVEMDSAVPPPERRLAVSRLFPDRTWPLDVVVYTPDEVGRLRGKRGTLLAEIEAQGRILYERG